MIQPSPHLKDNYDLIICITLASTQRNQNTVLIKNNLEHPYTPKKRSHFLTFSMLTRKQVKYNKPVKTVPLRHLLDTNHDDAFKYVNTILKMPKCEQSKERFSLPKPQEPGDETQHTAIQKRTLQELLALHKFEHLNPKDNQNSYHKFLSYFDWTDSTLDNQTHQATEELLVEVHD